MNSLQEVSGASQEGQTCTVSSLISASSNDVGGSKVEVFEAATAVTATSWRKE